MKTTLVSILILCCAPAIAAKISNFKCSDLPASKETVTPEYLAVMDGYDKAGKKVSEEVDFGSIVTESKQVNEKCAKNKSARIGDIRKELKTAKLNSVSNAAPNTNAKLNPIEAKCKDFLSLGEEVQPVVVFWNAGRDKAGKLQKGEIDEEFIAQPIATLVEECTANPTASFYDKTKAWIKKHL